MAGVLHMRARCKTGLVASKQGTLAHFPTDFRTAFARDGSTHFCAVFLCGNRTNDAIALASVEDAAAMCEVCEDTAKGPCVYRCFSATGDLLYIGSAGARLKRFKSHRSQTEWWPEAVDIQVEWFPTIFEARRAEWLAILAENPRYNETPKRRIA